MSRPGLAFALLSPFLAVLLLTVGEGRAPVDLEAREQSTALPPGMVIAEQDEGPAEADQMARLLLRGGDGQAPRGRPARTGTVAGEIPHSPAAHRIGPDFATTQIMDAAMVMADAALPWRFHLSSRLVDRRDDQAVLSGVADWDGVAGSRWASLNMGESAVRTAKADGRSLIFLEESCEGTTNANTYVFTDGGVGLYRYGASGTMVVEADIGLCPRLTDPADIRRTVRHEVGHVVGLSHLCDPGEECHVSAMLDGNQCSTMFWQSRRCQQSLDDGTVAGLQTLYSTLRPLHGPTDIQATARASFATVSDGAAPAVVVTEISAPQPVAAAAAAAAARADGTWLLGVADEAQCLTDTVRAEVNRALARRGTLTLVGDWPDSCVQLAFDWDLQLQVIGSPRDTPAAEWTPDDQSEGIARADRALAELHGRSTGQSSGGTIVISPADLGTAVHTSTAALAGALDAPLLHTRRGALPTSTVEWLQIAQPEHVVVVGPSDDRLAEQLSSLESLDVTHLAGTDDIHTALLAGTHAWTALAEQGVLPAEVVLISDGQTLTSLAAATLATARGAIVIATSDVVDGRVATWLAQRDLDQGWAVGPPAVLPEEVVRTYASAVG